VSSVVGSKALLRNQCWHHHQHIEIGGQFTFASKKSFLRNNAPLTTTL
jgi:hypothetical protein